VIQREVAKSEVADPCCSDSGEEAIVELEKAIVHKLIKS